MFGVPILTLARGRPMVRTSTPPGSTTCAPKICSTRTRSEDFVRLLCLACPVRGLPRFPLAMDVAGQLSGFEHRLDPGRAPGGVGPDPGTGIAARQQFIHRLAVMHGRVGDVIPPDQLVFAIHIDLVPGAVMRRAGLARRENSPPDCFLILLALPGIQVFPGVFRRLVFPIPGHLARFDRHVFLAFVVGAKHRHNPSVPTRVRHSTV